MSRIPVSSKSFPLYAKSKNCIGVARFFKMRGGKGGLRGKQGGDWDSKCRLSIDLCTKCNFIWGREGGKVSVRPPLSPPPATPLKNCRGKLGNGEHLSLKAYKYKENNIYVIIIKQHKEHIKFYPETHIYRHNFSRYKVTL